MSHDDDDVKKAIDAMRRAGLHGFEISIPPPELVSMAITAYWNLTQGMGLNDEAREGLIDVVLTLAAATVRVTGRYPQCAAHMQLRTLWDSMREKEQEDLDAMPDEDRQ